MSWHLKKSAGVSVMCINIFYVVGVCALYLYCFGTLFLWKKSDFYEVFELYYSIIDAISTSYGMLIQFAWGRITDSHPLLGALPVAVTILFMYLLTGERGVWLIVRHSLQSAAVLLVIPLTCKIFAITLMDDDLNLAFCILGVFEIFAKVLTALSDNQDVKADAILMKLILITIFVLLIFLVSFALRMKTVKKKPTYCISIYTLLKCRIVVNLMASALLLKFAETFTIRDNMIAYFIAISKYSRETADTVIGISGFIGGISLCLISNDHTVIKYLYRIQLFCYPILYIGFHLAKYEIFDCSFVCFCIGLFFLTPDFLLMTAVPVRLGENYAQSGATLTGLIATFGMLGEALAMIAVRVIPRTLSIFVILISSLVLTYSLYTLCHCKAPLDLPHYEFSKI